MKYIALDCESGGIGHEKSLLTIYLKVLDISFHTIDELDLKIKPNDKVYHCTAEAMGVNGINIVEHDKIAISETEAARELYQFIKWHSNDGADKLIPVGHNVAFDIGMIKAKLLASGSWDKHVSYRMLDTGIITQFFKAKGRIPETVSGSLASLGEYFHLEGKNTHVAKDDVNLTIEVMKELLKL